MSNLNLNGNISNNEKLLYESYKSLLSFGKLFLTKDFMKSDTPEMHKEICAEMDTGSTKPLAIILPRDSAKSTIMRAKFLKDLVFAKTANQWGFGEEKNLFIGWVAASQRKSVRNIRYIRFHLNNNPLIKYYFGKGEGIIGQTNNQEELNTIYGDRIISSSNLTTIRGDSEVSMYGETVRYSSVACDDIEHENNTLTDEAREKIRDNILRGILPAIEHNEGNRLIIIGTPVHYDAFVQRLLDQWIKAVAEEGGSNPLYWTKDKHELEARERARANMAFHVIAYKSTQPELPGGVLWDSFIPKSILEEKLRIASEANDISSYYQERELEVENQDIAIFGKKVVRYWNGYYEHSDGINYIVSDGERKPINVFAGCDPATDINTKRADYSVILTIGVDANNNVYVLDYIRRRNIPTLGERGVDGKLLDQERKGVVDYIVEQNDKYHAIHTVVEDVAMTRSVFQSLNAERRRLNRYDVYVIPESPGGQNKRNKINSSLAGRFASSSIFIRENHYELENEIVKFGPKMQHDDTIESLYFACLRSYPCNIKKSANGSWNKGKRKKAKSWIVN